MKNPIYMMNENKNIPSRIEDLSEDQKLELFQVEELESRLEMVAAADALVEVNGVCW